jgi:transcriptional regulator with XRE-family HTH domain
VDFDSELGCLDHLLPIWQRIAKTNTVIAHPSILTPGQWADTIRLVRKSPKRIVPEGFIRLLREGMERWEISLNQLAERAGMSPAFLSRIMNKQRGLPSDEAILRLARVLDLQPNERLLIEAGRVPDGLMFVLTQPRVPELLRVAGKLSETEQQELLKTAKALALRRRRGGKKE